MNLQQLNYFVELAKVQNYTQAAKKLHISQPSLHIAISKLEDEIEAKLFEKKGRNIFLTQQGQVFLAYVENSLLTLNHGLTELQTMNAVDTGTINIAYVYTVATRFIPKLVRLYKDQFPESRFTFHQGTTFQIIDDLIEGKVDIGFGFYYPFVEELNFDRISKQELVVIVSNEHPLAAQDSIDLDQLNALPFIRYTEGSWARITIDHILQDYHVSPNFLSDLPDEAAICGLVNQNLGVSIVVKTSNVRQSPHLKYLTINNPINQRHLNMIYSKKRKLNKACENFIDYVKENYKVD